MTWLEPKARLHICIGPGIAGGLETGGLQPLAVMGPLYVRNIMAYRFICKKKYRI